MASGFMKLLRHGSLAVGLRVLHEGVGTQHWHRPKILAETCAIEASWARDAWYEHLRRWPRMVLLWRRRTRLRRMVHVLHLLVLHTVLMLEHHVLVPFLLTHVVGILVGIEYTAVNETSSVAM